MEKKDTIERIRRTGVLPVVRAASADEAALLIERLIAGGVDVIEITMTVPHAEKLIADSAKKYAANAVIGAGTVLDAKAAERCIDAGAKFVVSPALDIRTIEFCNTEDIAVMPGALTPTEVVTAWNAGADIVKVFPAGAMGGSSYLRSLKAPLPQIKLIPTGGVTLETAADFIRAGAEAIGVGADLVSIDALRTDPNSITETARKYLKAVADAR